MDVTINYTFGRFEAKLATAQINGIFYARKGKTWEKARDAVLKEIVEDLSRSPVVPASQQIKLEDKAA